MAAHREAHAGAFRPPPTILQQNRLQRPYAVAAAYWRLQRHCSGHRILRARPRQGGRLLDRRLLKAAIVGIAGTTLSADEAALFRKCPPAGVILFARNIEDP